MINSNMKSKLTLWVPKDIKEFGKKWGKRHDESLSRIFSKFLGRIKEQEENTQVMTPLVRRISGVIKSKTAGRKSYEQKLEGKYL